MSHPEASGKLLLPVNRGRRQFLQSSAAGLLAAGSGGLFSGALLNVTQAAEAAKHPVAETAVRDLYATLTDVQKKSIAFAWDHKDSNRGLLRTHVNNNWQITKPDVDSKFYTDEQKQIVRTIFEGLIHPDWHARYYKQIEDDNGGFGLNQTIALFGTPDDENFEFVMTGRHMTLRCDGKQADHIAFGGPIFYGHDAGGSMSEAPDHPGNVFWEQALEANQVYQMLDGKQRKQAEVARTPNEGDCAFRPAGEQRPGLPVSEMSADQQAALQKVLLKLIEPYRQSDRDEIVACLKKQGGLENCSLAFYTDNDLGKDRVWDNWRLEGPAFVWHFRGAPHVHVWVNIAGDPKVATNTPFANRQQRRS